MRPMLIVAIAVTVSAGAADVFAQSWQPPSESQRCPSKWGAGDLSGNPVTGLVRDFVDGSVYIATFGGEILKYDALGSPELFATAKHPARISIAPNGFLYAIERPPPYYDHMPVIERWELPKTR